MISYRNVSYDDYEDDYDLKDTVSYKSFHNISELQASASTDSQTQLNKNENLITNDADCLNECSNATKNQLYLNIHKPDLEHSSSPNNSSFKKSTNDLLHSQILSINLNELALNDSCKADNLLPLSNSFTSGTMNEVRELMGKSMSSLNINKNLCNNNLCKSQHACDNTCPLASEEQSCMSTPNATKSSLSIDSIYKQNMVINDTLLMNSPISRPNKLSLIENNYNDLFFKRNLVNSNRNLGEFVQNTSKALHDANMKNLFTNTNSEANDSMPRIQITDTCDNNHQEIRFNLESDSNNMQSSRSPSIMGYLTSASSLAITPTSMDRDNLNLSSNCLGPNRNANSSGKSRLKLTPPPLYLLPPSVSSSAIKTNSQNLNLNSSSSSNNLSSRLNEFNFLSESFYYIYET